MNTLFRVEDEINTAKDGSIQSRSHNLQYKWQVSFYPLHLHSLHELARLWNKGGVYTRICSVCIVILDILVLPPVIEDDQRTSHHPLYKKYITQALCDIAYTQRTQLTYKCEFRQLDFGSYYNTMTALSQVNIHIILLCCRLELFNCLIVYWHQGDNKGLQSLMGYLASVVCS